MLIKSLVATESPFATCHVDKLTITGPHNIHNHSFFTREGRNEVHGSQDGFVLSQCSRRSHPVVSDDDSEEVNELQVVEDICETPPPSNDDDQELNSIHTLENLHKISL